MWPVHDSYQLKKPVVCLWWQKSWVCLIFLFCLTGVALFWVNYEWCQASLCDPVALMDPLVFPPFILSLSCCDSLLHTTSSHYINIFERSFHFFWTRTWITVWYSVRLPYKTKTPISPLSLSSLETYVEASHLTIATHVVTVHVLNIFSSSMWVKHAPYP